MNKQGNQRFSRKGELVDEEEKGKANLTEENRNKNPYKTPPNNLTSKRKDVFQEKGGDGK